VNKRFLVVMAILVIVGVGAVSFAKPQPAHAWPIAPNWLVEVIKQTFGNDAAQTILYSMGDYQCDLPWLITCYQKTSQEPSRWFRYGVVQTGNGSTGYLRARYYPSTSAPVVRTFPENWKLVIFCQTEGPWVYGRWGWTNMWDYVGPYNGKPMFVSDGFVYTGSNGYVAGRCDTTNMGNNWLAS
jgi:hypothetical protein